MANQQIIPADMILPNKLRVIPLSGKPIFPGIFTPMMIGNSGDVQVIESSLSTDAFIGLVLVREPDTDSPSAEDLFSVGTLAKIVKKINLPDGGLNIFISTIKRFSVKKVLSKEHPIVVAVEYLEDQHDGGIEIQALTRSLIGEMKQISENNPLFSEEMRLNMVNIDHPGKIADFITSILNIDRAEQQRILETVDVRRRMEQVLIYIKKEQELLRIQKKIQTQINEKIEKSQREYFLKEQLKAIKTELGVPADGKTSEYNRFKEAIESLQLTDEVREQVEKELEKFALMEPMSADFGVTRNYLDMIVSLPWSDPPAEDIDINRAQRVLDEDHYGLEDVKDRILEFIAVRKLKKDFTGSIICLVGPPGVGKTSVGRSIARALKKQFFRFSVGGMRDEAEIKGHRRTYVGAMPGKIIQGLKIVKTKSPVFMIDEIDKLGASFQGDPSSALLEVLDPEQNYAFRDHYLDLPFDISRVVFVATANTLDTVPGPLIDRMEIIRLSGYIDQEKLAIARKYLIPKSAAKHGLRPAASGPDATNIGKITFTKNGLLAIANRYAREAGVRNFEKSIDRINRKIARNVVSAAVATDLVIDENSLEGYLGRPIFRDDETRKITGPGMAVGLAWTSVGGDTLMIEAVANPGKEGFKLTGQMGNVMQESAGIAYTYVRHIAEVFGVSAEYFEKNTIHLHIPAGATPKDGPSAGITMASTLLSLCTNRKIKAKLAMTGELSLAGKVLPIGGLKEKVIAARRHGIKSIIIPVANERDLDDIPEHVRRGIAFLPVETMDQVIDKLF